MYAEGGLFDATTVLNTVLDATGNSVAVIAPAKDGLYSCQFSVSDGNGGLLNSAYVFVVDGINVTSNSVPGLIPAFIPAANNPSNDMAALFQVVDDAHFANAIGAGVSTWLLQNALAAPMLLILGFCPEVAVGGFALAAGLLGISLGAEVLKSLTNEMVNANELSPGSRDSINAVADAAESAVPAVVAIATASELTGLVVALQATNLACKQVKTADGTSPSLLCQYMTDTASKWIVLLTYTP